MRTTLLLMILLLATNCRSDWGDDTNIFSGDEPNDYKVDLSEEEVTEEEETKKPDDCLIDDEDEDEAEDEQD